MTTILSLDTTSKFASISISTDTGIILEYNFATKDELSGTLIPSIEFLLNSASLQLRDIDLFGIGIGPGLFTSLRVGLSTFKGMLLGLDKPVVPVVTLHALAYKYLDTKIPLASMVDARRNEIYTAVYIPENGELKEIIPPALIHIDQLKDHLSNVGPCNFVGSGADAHKETLKTRFNPCKIFHPSYFLASEICKIAFAKYQKKEFFTDLQKIMPLYIRKPDAEQNLLLKQKKSGSQG